MRTYTISAELLGALIEAAAHGAQDLEYLADDAREQRAHDLAEYQREANAAWSAVEQGRALLARPA